MWNAPILELSRLRWLMEPSLTLTQIEVTGDSVNAAAAWDPLVEQRSEASLLRLSLDQRVQTKRGPLGDRRTHDVLELRTALVLHDTETPFDPTQPPRYDPLRPEYGIRRDHVEIPGVLEPWNLSFHRRRRHLGPRWRKFTCFGWGVMATHRHPTDRGGVPKVANRSDRFFGFHL